MCFSSSTSLLHETSMVGSFTDLPFESVEELHVPCDNTPINLSQQFREMGGSYLKVKFNDVIAKLPLIHATETITSRDIMEPKVVIVKKDCLRFLKQADT